MHFRSLQSLSSPLSSGLNPNTPDITESPNILNPALTSENKTSTIPSITNLVILDNEPRKSVARLYGFKRSVKNHKTNIINHTIPLEIAAISFPNSLKNEIMSPIGSSIGLSIALTAESTASKPHQ